VVSQLRHCRFAAGELTEDHKCTLVKRGDIVVVAGNDVIARADDDAAALRAGIRRLRGGGVFLAFLMRGELQDLEVREF